MITQPGHASWRFAETGSRGAVLRRSEGTRFSSGSDDEVGGTKARSGPAMFAPLICRRSRRNASRCRADSRSQSFRRSRRRRRLPGEHRREHSEPSDTASLASGAIKLGSRAAVLSQAGAPLSWTSERADALFVCERVRKAAANKRRPQRAERAMHRERGDTFFVPERRQSRRHQERDPRGASLASGAIKPGSRAAVLRRSEPTRLFVDELQQSWRLFSAIRAGASLASEAIKHAPG
jgi:hypothetical protein